VQLLGDRPTKSFPPVDYKSDAQFWYNLPANFDIVDACYRMYLWTGDISYIEDPIFLKFYNHTMTDYIARWNLSPDRIMKRTSNIETPPFFRGDPTYEESSRNNLAGIDLLAAQYAAYRAYAAIQAIQGDRQPAQWSLQNAAHIKSLINTVWWNSSQGYFYAYFNKQRQFTGRAGSALLYHNAADAGPKTQSALHSLLATIKTKPESAVEAKSHYAEILYRYRDPATAYAQIMDLTRKGRVRREYPEISYSVIGALVTGLMGIRVRPTLSLSEIISGKPFATVLESLPQLTVKTDWAEFCNLPVEGNIVCVRHEGNRSTSLTNHGIKPLKWKVAFTGSFPKLLANGKPLKANARSEYLGRVETWVDVEVPSGSTLQVKAS
jgi:hypothetical protein